MNPEKIRECECCFVETDEPLFFDVTKEWLCIDCYNHAERILTKIASDYND